MSKYAKYNKVAKVGDPSSKYAYGRFLDADIENKHEEFEKLKVGIISYLDILLNTKVKYNDGTVMSRSAKTDAMRQAFAYILRQEGEL